MNNQNEMNETDHEDLSLSPVVYSYTRAQAIEDGVLVDISELAKEAGFKFPVAVTCRVFELLNDTYQAGQSFEGRAWDVLMVLRFEIKKSGGSDTVYFSPHFNTKDHSQPRPYKLWSKCGPGDDAEPVITVMFTDED